MERIGHPAVRLCGRKFWVTLGVLGIFVMREMEETEPDCRYGQNESAPGANDLIERCTAKRRQMRRFVHQCEQEDEKDTLRQKQDRPTRQRVHDPRC